MKKVIVSLLVLAFVALAATGTVSAQCAAQTTTTNVATTCAQCTSCTTSTCCSCPCVTTCCCPTVACCVVTQCCEVKTVKAMHEMPVKEAKEAKEVKGEEMGAAAAVATKGSAAVVGSGQASVATQTIGDQTQTVGAITASDSATVTVNFASQTAVNANVPINVQIKDSQFNPAIAWGDSQAATNGGTNSASSTVTDLNS